MLAHAAAPGSKLLDFIINGRCILNSFKQGRNIICLYFEKKLLAAAWTVNCGGRRADAQEGWRAPAFQSGEVVGSGLILHLF